MSFHVLLKLLLGRQAKPAQVTLESIVVGHRVSEWILEFGLALEAELLDIRDVNVVYGRQMLGAADLGVEALPTLEAVELGRTTLFRWDSVAFVHVVVENLPASLELLAALRAFELIALGAVGRASAMDLLMLPHERSTGEHFAANGTESEQQI